jgi:hypothetical protein
MEENKEIVITNQFPEKEYNLLIPVQTMQEISPLHKVIINQVSISPDLADKDVYKQGSELALTKKGLAKLMTASNINIVESVPVLPNVCRKCTEVAKATKLAPRCGDCPSKNDVAYRVTVGTPGPTGELRYFQGSKNSTYSDAKSATEKQFLNEQCETKALNRALRGAMMIKSTYTAAELKKPFVVAVVVENLADEDMKKAKIAQYIESTSMLFGNKNKALGAPVDLSNANIVVVPEDEEVGGDDIPTMDAEIIEGIDCQGCGERIEALNDEWPVERLIENSKKKYKGKALCAECQRKLQEQVKKEKEANAAKEGKSNEH